MATKTPFTRIPVLDVASAAAAVNDIYDKLQIVASLSEKSTTTPATPTPATGNPSLTVTVTGGSGGSSATPALSIQGATGLAASPQYSFLPQLTALPSTTPSQGAPYTQDGLVIMVSPSSQVAGPQYRYSSRYVKWVPLGGAGASIVGTHAQRLASYPAAGNIGSIYYETDRSTYYIAYAINGTNPQWVWMGGEMSGTTVSTDQRPADLATYDAGFLFLSSDAFYTYEWTGSAWQIVETYTDKVSIVRPTNSTANELNLGTGSTIDWQVGSVSGDSDFSVVLVGSGTKLTVLKASGKVGVANTAPAYPLDVTGDINTSTTYRVGGVQLDILATQAANKVLAGPSSGSAAIPTFRALVTADLPAGTGTVTSVSLTMPGIFGVSGSPVTASGGFTVTLSTQGANLVFAGPTSGSAAAPTFRSLVSADLPGSTGITSITISPPNYLGVSPATLTSNGTFTFTWDTLTNNYFFAGPSAGSGQPSFRQIYTNDLGTETTGSGSALLGTNCPAGTLTAPYAWLEVEDTGGHFLYIPMWK